MADSSTIPTSTDFSGASNNNGGIDIGKDNTDNGNGNQFYGDRNQAEGNGNWFLSGQESASSNPFNTVLSGENNPFESAGESAGPPAGITGGIPFESMGGNNPVLAGGGSAPAPAGDGTTPESALNPTADDNTTNGNGNWFFGSGNSNSGNGNWNFGNKTEVEGNGNWNLGDSNSVSGNGNRPSGSDNTVSGNGNRVSGDNNKVSGNGFDIAEGGMDVYGNGDRYLSTDSEGNVTLVDDKSASNPNFDFTGVVGNEANGDETTVSKMPITGLASEMASAAMGGAALTASDTAMPGEMPSETVTNETATNETVTNEASSAMGESNTDMMELLRQSPFGVLLDIPGVDSVEDIFGNVGGENPFGGAGGADGSEMGSPMGNPFANWDPVRDGNPFIQGDEPDTSAGGTAYPGAPAMSPASETPGEVSMNEVVPMSEMPDSPASGDSNTDGFGIDMATSGTDMAASGMDMSNMSDADLTELLKQSPFGVLFDIPGVDSVEDIFGNVDGAGGNPFAGGGNPFGGGAAGGGNPFGGGAGGTGGEEAPPEGYEYNFDDVDGVYSFDNAEGTGGAGGGNPFGGGGEAGAGGNPFGGGGESGAGGNPFGGEAGMGGTSFAGDNNNPFATGENPFAEGEEPVPTDALLGGILKDDGKVTLSEEGTAFFDSFTGDELMEGGLSNLQSVISGLSELQTTITSLQSGEFSPLELATSVLTEGLSLDPSEFSESLGQVDSLAGGIMRASGFFERQLAYLEEAGLINIDKTVAAPTEM